MANANDRQVGGNHYKHTYQHWDFMADAYHSPVYFVGNLTKYAMRWRAKKGLEDVQKAIHYADKLMELTEQGRVVASEEHDTTPLEQLRPRLSDLEAEILYLAVSHNDIHDLKLVRGLLAELEAEAKRWEARTKGAGQ